MEKLKISFCYDGTYYHGWQRQKNTPNTIQAILENRVTQILGKKTSVVASGRTDTGVHARIQVAHFNVEKSIEHQKLQNSLNSLLPPDIRVWKVEATSSDFHASRNVEKKTYLYFIDPSLVQWPTLRNYAWNLRRPLDWTAMELATQKLIGVHDFKAFCASDSSAKTTVREIFEAKWGEAQIPGEVFSQTSLKALRITGAGFLKQMVRSIVGTLVLIGSGKAQPELIDEALTSRNRSIIGPTAPSRGLWLWDILYS